MLDSTHCHDNDARIEFLRTAVTRRVSQAALESTVDEVFATFIRPFKEKEVPLSEVLDCKDCGIKHQRVGCGIEQKGKSDLAERLYYEGSPQNKSDHRYLIGADLDRDGWVVDTTHERYFRHSFASILNDNEIVYFSEPVFDLPQKIVWRQTSDRIRASIIGPGWFANTLQAGVPRDARYNLHFILGILNSRFLNFLYTENVKEAGRVFPQVKLSKVRSLPFSKPDLDTGAGRNAHDKMVDLVTTRISLARMTQSVKLPNRREQLQREIDATDRQIDQLVYELYGLNDEEIRIVEEATA